MFGMHRLTGMGEEEGCLVELLLEQRELRADDQVPSAGDEQILVGPQRPRRRLQREL